MPARNLALFNSQRLLCNRFQHHKVDMDSNIASSFSPKWQFRFDFFNTNGAPNSPAFKAAYKALPFGQKIKVNFNFFALFFGCIYLFILGMWRKALTILGLTLVLGVVLAFLPDPIGRGIAIAWSLFIALTTNYNYYLEKVKGDTSWNPFQGMRW